MDRETWEGEGRGERGKLTVRLLWARCLLKTFANQVSYKRLTSKVHKEFIQLNSKTHT